MSSIDHPLLDDYPDLREALKRCPPATYYAACKFRKTGAREHLHEVILGVIERFVERDLRPKLHGPCAELRLRDDLGLDSLTLMEIVMLAEEVLPISISNEELNRLRTIGDVQQFFAGQLCERAAAPAASRSEESWPLAPASAQKL